MLPDDMGQHNDPVNIENNVRYKIVLDEDGDEFILDDLEIAQDSYDEFAKCSVVDLYEVVVDKEGEISDETLLKTNY